MGSYVTVCGSKLQKEQVLHGDIFQERIIDAVVMIPSLKKLLRKATQNTFITAQPAQADAHTCTNKLEFIW